jgi:hypothetical protein
MDGEQPEAERKRSMPEPDSQPRPPRGSSDERRSAEAPQPLTDELVRQVADKVYAMLVADLALERERRQRTSGGVGITGEW